MKKKNLSKEVTTENSNCGISEEMQLNPVVDRNELNETSAQEKKTSDQQNIDFQPDRIIGNTETMKNYIVMPINDKCVILHDLLPILERSNEPILIEIPCVGASPPEGYSISSSKTTYVLTNQRRMNSNESSPQDTSGNSSQQVRSTLVSSEGTGENTSNCNQGDVTVSPSVEQVANNSSSGNIISSLNLEQFKDLEFVNTTEGSNWSKSISDGKSECGEDSGDEERFLIGVAHETERRFRRQTKLRRK